MNFKTLKETVKAKFDNGVQILTHRAVPIVKKEIANNASKSLCETKDTIVKIVTLGALAAVIFSPSGKNGSVGTTAEVLKAGVNISYTYNISELKVYLKEE